MVTSEQSTELKDTVTQKSTALRTIAPHQTMSVSEIAADEHTTELVETAPQKMKPSRKISAQQAMGVSEVVTAEEEMSLEESRTSRVQSTKSISGKHEAYSVSEVVTAEEGSQFISETVEKHKSSRKISSQHAYSVSEVVAAEEEGIFTSKSTEKTKSTRKISAQEAMSVSEVVIGEDESQFVRQKTETAMPDKSVTPQQAVTVQDVMVADALSEEVTTETLAGKVKPTPSVTGHQVYSVSEVVTAEQGTEFENIELDKKRPTRKISGQQAYSVSEVVTAEEEGVFITQETDKEKSMRKISTQEAVSVSEVMTTEGETQFEKFVPTTAKPSRKVSAQQAVAVQDIVVSEDMADLQTITPNKEKSQRKISAQEGISVVEQQTYEQFGDLQTSLPNKEKPTKSISAAHHAASVSEVRTDEKTGEFEKSQVEKVTSTRKISGQQAAQVSQTTVFESKQDFSGSSMTKAMAQTSFSEQKTATTYDVTVGESMEEFERFKEKTESATRKISAQEAGSVTIVQAGEGLSDLDIQRIGKDKATPVVSTQEGVHISEIRTQEDVCKLKTKTPQKDTASTEFSTSMSMSVLEVLTKEEVEALVKGALEKDKARVIQQVSHASGTEQVVTEDGLQDLEKPSEVAREKATISRGMHETNIVEMIVPGMTVREFQGKISMAKDKAIVIQEMRKAGVTEETISLLTTSEIGEKKPAERTKAEIRQDTRETQTTTQVVPAMTTAAFDGKIHVDKQQATVTTETVESKITEEVVTGITTGKYEKMEKVGREQATVTQDLRETQVTQEVIPGMVAVEMKMNKEAEKHTAALTTDALQSQVIEETVAASSTASFEGKMHVQKEKAMLKQDLLQSKVTEEVVTGVSELQFTDKVKLTKEKAVISQGTLESQVTEEVVTGIATTQFEGKPKAAKEKATVAQNIIESQVTEEVVTGMTTTQFRGKSQVDKQQATIAQDTFESQVTEEVVTGMSALQFQEKPKVVKEQAQVAQDIKESQVTEEVVAGISEVSFEGKPKVAKQQVTVKQDVLQSQVTQEIVTGVSAGEFKRKPSLAKEQAIMKQETFESKVTEEVVPGVIAGQFEGKPKTSKQQAKIAQDVLETKVTEEVITGFAAEKFEGKPKIAKQQATVARDTVESKVTEEVVMGVSTADFAGKPKAPKQQANIAQDILETQMTEEVVAASSTTQFEGKVSPSKQQAQVKQDLLKTKVTEEVVTGVAAEEFVGKPKARKEQAIVSQDTKESRTTEEVVTGATAEHFEGKAAAKKEMAVVSQAIAESHTTEEVVTGVTAEQFEGKPKARKEQAQVSRGTIESHVTEEVVAGVTTKKFEGKPKAKKEQAKISQDISESHITEEVVTGVAAEQFKAKTKARKEEATLTQDVLETQVTEEVITGVHAGEFEAKTDIQKQKAFLTQDLVESQVTEEVVAGVSTGEFQRSDVTTKEQAKITQELMESQVTEEVVTGVSEQQFVEKPKTPKEKALITQDVLETKVTEEVVAGMTTDKLSEKLEDKERAKISRSLQETAVVEQEEVVIGMTTEQLAKSVERKEKTTVSKTVQDTAVVEQQEVVTGSTTEPLAKEVERKEKAQVSHTEQNTAVVEQQEVVTGMTTEQLAKSVDTKEKAAVSQTLQDTAVVEQQEIVTGVTEESLKQTQEAKEKATVTQTLQESTEEKTTKRKTSKKKVSETQSHLDAVVLRKESKQEQHVKIVESEAYGRTISMTPIQVKDDGEEEAVPIIEEVQDDAEELVTPVVQDIQAIVKTEAELSMLSEIELEKGMQNIFKETEITEEVEGYPEASADDQPVPIVEEVIDEEETETKDGKKKIITKKVIKKKTKQSLQKKQDETSFEDERKDIEIIPMTTSEEAPVFQTEAEFTFTSVTDAELEKGDQRVTIQEVIEESTECFPEIENDMAEEVSVILDETVKLHDNDEREHSEVITKKKVNKVKKTKLKEKTTPEKIEDAADNQKGKGVAISETDAKLHFNVTSEVEIEKGVEEVTVEQTIEEDVELLAEVEIKEKEEKPEETKEEKPEETKEEKLEVIDTSVKKDKKKIMKKKSKIKKDTVDEYMHGDLKEVEQKEKREKEEHKPKQGIPDVTTESVTTELHIPLKFHTEVEKEKDMQITEVQFEEREEVEKETETEAPVTEQISQIPEEITKPKKDEIQSLEEITKKKTIKVKKTKLKKKGGSENIDSVDEPEDEKVVVSKTEAELPFTATSEVELEKQVEEVTVAHTVEEDVELSATAELIENVKEEILKEDENNVRREKKKIVKKKSKIKTDTMDEHKHEEIKEEKKQEEEILKVTTESVTTEINIPLKFLSEVEKEKSIQITEVQYQESEEVEKETEDLKEDEIQSLKEVKDIPRKDDSITIVKKKKIIKKIKKKGEPEEIITKEQAEEEKPMIEDIPVPKYDVLTSDEVDIPLMAVTEVEKEKSTLEITAEMETCENIELNTEDAEIETATNFVPEQEDQTQKVIKVIRKKKVKKVKEEIEDNKLDQVENLQPETENLQEAQKIKEDSSIISEKETVIFKTDTEFPSMVVTEVEKEKDTQETELQLYTTEEIELTSDIRTEPKTSSEEPSIEPLGELESGKLAQEAEKKKKSIKKKKVKKGETETQSSTTLVSEVEKLKGTEKASVEQEVQEKIELEAKIAIAKTPEVKEADIENVEKVQVPDKDERFEDIKKKKVYIKRPKEVLEEKKTEIVPEAIVSKDLADNRAEAQFTIIAVTETEKEKLGEKISSEFIIDTEEVELLPEKQVLEETIPQIEEREVVRKDETSKAAFKKKKVKKTKEENQEIKISEMKPKETPVKETIIEDYVTAETTSDKEEPKPESVLIPTEVTNIQTTEAEFPSVTTEETELIKGQEMINAEAVMEEETELYPQTEPEVPTLTEEQPLPDKPEKQALTRRVSLKKKKVKKSTKEQILQDTFVEQKQIEIEEESVLVKKPVITDEMLPEVIDEHKLKDRNKIKESEINGKQELDVLEQKLVEEDKPVVEEMKPKEEPQEKVKIKIKKKSKATEEETPKEKLVEKEKSPSQEPASKTSQRVETAEAEFHVVETSETEKEKEHQKVTIQDNVIEEIELESVQDIDIDVQKPEVELEEIKPEVKLEAIKPETEQDKPEKKKIKKKKSKPSESLEKESIKEDKVEDIVELQVPKTQQPENQEKTEINQPADELVIEKIEIASPLIEESSVEKEKENIQVTLQDVVTEETEIMPEELQHDIPKPEEKDVDETKVTIIKKKKKVVKSRKQQPQPEADLTLTKPQEEEDYNIEDVETKDTVPIKKEFKVQDLHLPLSVEEEPRTIKTQAIEFTEEIELPKVPISSQIVEEKEIETTEIEPTKPKMAEEIETSVKLKKPEKKKPESPESVIILKVKDEEPKETIEDVQEAFVIPTKPEKQQYIVEETEDTAATICIKKKPEEVPFEVEEIDTEVIIKPKIMKEESIVEQSTVIKQPEKKIQQHEDIQETFIVQEKPKESPYIIEKDEDASETITIKKKEEQLPYKVEEIDTEIKIKKKKHKKKEEIVESSTVIKLPDEKPSKLEDVEEAFTIQEKSKEIPYVIEEDEDTSATIKIQKKFEEQPYKVEEIDTEFKIKPKVKKVKQEQEVVENSTVIKLPQRKPEPSEDVQEAFTIQDKPKEVPYVIEEDEDTSATIKIKNKTEDRPYKVEEVDTEVKIKKKKEKKEKEVLESSTVIKIPSEKSEEPEDVEEAFTIQEKPKEVPYVVEEDEDTTATIKIKKKAEDRSYKVEEVDTEVKIKKKKEKKKRDVFESSAVIKLSEETPEEPEDVEEAFTIQKQPKEVPYVVEDDEDTSATIKIKKKPEREYAVEDIDTEVKIKRKKQVHKDEHVQGAAVLKLKEDETKVEQPEDVEESFTLSDNTTEKSKYKIEEGEKIDATIKIRRKSKQDDRVYQVEETETEVRFKKKRKPKPEPQVDTSVSGEGIFRLKEEEPDISEDWSDIDEEFSIDLPSEPKEIIPVIGEEESNSLLVTLPRKQVGAIVHGVAVEEPEDDEYLLHQVKPGDAMYSMATYVAEEDHEHEDVLHLVEGERVYIIETHNSDWWFVKKHLTGEAGWVPASYLKDEVTYTHFVTSKITDKINKLPVFEKPKPGEPIMAPRFIEKLKPQSAPDGATVQLECIVEGFPRPVITWFRQTAIIRPSQDFQIFYDEDNTATLIIAEVFPEDAGTFTIVAKNGAGFASSSTTLTVEAPLSDHGSEATFTSRRSLSRESSLADLLDGIPPTFAARPRTVIVDEGSTVELDCRLVAVPEPEITWSFNNEPLVESKRVMLTKYADIHMYHHLVRIEDVTKTDTGTYKVVAKNREGESVNYITLSVESKHPPEILEHLKPTTVKEKGSVSMSTRITGVPHPRVLWKHNGKELRASNHIRTLQDGELHTLRILEATKKDAGAYSVQADNAYGRVDTIASLEVKGLSRDEKAAPVFVETYKDSTFNEDEDLVLHARIVGGSPMEIAWIRDGTHLKETDNVVITTSTGGLCSLTISELNAEQDSGEYTCVATNPKGKASHSAIISITTKIVFTKKLVDMVVDEKNDVVLECVTNKECRTQWYKNGKKVKPGSKKHIATDEGFQHRLVIKEMTPADVGIYKCETENSDTEATVDLKATFIQKLHDIEVTELQPATLVVKVNPATAKVTWHRDGVKIEEDDERFTMVTEKQIRKLIIKSASVHDEGEYTCCTGDQECTAEVSVTELPPDFVIPLRDTSAPKGDTAVLEVELTKGDAMPRWFKDGKEVVVSDRVKIHIDGKHQMLIINDVRDEDIGTYTCTIGEKKCSANFTIGEASAKFLTKLPERVNVPLDSDTTLSVTLSSPDIPVKWYREGKEIKPDDRHQIINDGAVHTLIIKRSTKDDEAEYTCVAQSIRTSTNLYVEETESAPKVDSSFQKEYYVKKDGEIEISIPFTSVPKPKVTVMYKGKVIKEGPMMSFQILNSCVTLRLKNVDESKIGDYKVKLSNSCGEVSAEFTVKLLEKPAAPGKPEPVEVTDSSVTLHWKKPATDGGSKITKYIIEYTEKTTKKWTVIKEVTDVEETSCTVDGLTKDTILRFRVSAENAIGRTTSMESKFITVAFQTTPEKPEVIEPLTDIFIGLKKELVVTCIIKGTPTPTITWLKNGTTLKGKKTTYEKNVAKLVIKETSDSVTGKYTVRAENSEGTVETSCNIAIQEPPVITYNDKLQSQKLHLKAQWKIVAQVTGIPKPDVHWERDGEILETTDHCAVHVGKEDTYIAIYSLERQDTGTYTLVAENAAKKETVDFSLRVVERPGAPEGPMIVHNVDAESIRIKWKPPQDDGGADIMAYTIEKLDVIRKVWLKVANVEASLTTYCIQDLMQGNEYMFRVMAENPVGRSDPLTSETVMVKSPHDIPSAPEGPFKVLNMADTSFILGWLPPMSDGGRPITEYMVEKREVGKKAWQKVGSTEADVTSIEVKNLKKDVAYHFRVAAVNEVGIGMFFSPEESITTGVKITPPSQPSNLSVTDVTIRSVSLSWSTPVNTGGAEITGYIIHKRLSSTTKWEKVVTLDASVTQYTVENLKNKSEYYFQVSAENPIGIGEPAETPKVYLKANATPPSPPTAPLEIHGIGPTSVVIEWGCPESDGGVPLLGYDVAIRDTSKTMWMQVGHCTAEHQRLSVKDLHEGRQYMVRVYARNEVGKSEPLENEEPITVVKPEDYREEDGGEGGDRDTPSLSFSTTTTSWMREAGVDADIHCYSKCSLIRRDEYFFRIWYYSRQLFK